MECFKSLRRPKVVPDQESSSDQSADTPQASHREEKRGGEERPFFLALHSSGGKEAASAAKQGSQELREATYKGGLSANQTYLAEEDSQASGGQEGLSIRSKEVSDSGPSSQPLLMGKSSKKHPLPKFPDPKSYLYTALSVGPPSGSSSDDTPSPSSSHPSQDPYYPIPPSSDPDYDDYAYILEAYGVIPPKGKVKLASPPRKTDSERLLEEYLFKRSRREQDLDTRDWMEVLQEQLDAERRKKRELEAYRKAAELRKQESGAANTPGAEAQTSASSSSSSWGKEGLEGVPLVSDTTLSVPNLGSTDKLTFADITHCLKKKAKISVNVEVPRVHPEVSEDEESLCNEEEGCPDSPQPVVEGARGGGGAAPHTGGMASSPVGVAGPSCDATG